ncbi:MAG: L-2-hydroxyglutarate oxidase, partial [Aliifodinibius sp.]|nr:L-2-hydroxyglutarate oxidase [Fodinibius sp.]NIV11878.1 L-2-hydroxyglutarate oxidase [Fodinibius sp.]NIY28967.1 L-2-hydroxyglutarate oxidase [Fodinibius sp.]
IFETGQINGIEGIKKIDPQEVTEIEPYVTNSVKGIHVPCSGIVDYVGVCQQLRTLIEQNGNRVACGQEVTN